MVKKERIDRTVENAIKAVKLRARLTAETEKQINDLIHKFEKKTGSKVLNKPFKLKLERVK